MQTTLACDISVAQTSRNTRDGHNRVNSPLDNVHTYFGIGVRIRSPTDMALCLLATDMTKKRGIIKLIVRALGL